MINLPKLLVFTTTLAFGSAFAADAKFDWPQWRGPNRDDVSKETGLLKEWPAGGPKKIWSFDKAGNGYAGVSIAAGRLYTMGIRDGKEVLFALDTQSGKELWATPMGNAFDGEKPGYNTGWGEGPRGTPTVDGDRVYALGAWGSLICASAKDGKVVWQKTMNDLGGQPFGWGYAESPLVDGAKLVCTPGGKSGTIAALNKMTGDLVWQSKDFKDAVQYSSMVPATINGTPQYVQVTMQSIVGINAKDGTIIWRTDWPGRTAVIPTPIVRGNQIFATAGYGVGCKSFTVGADNMLTELYRNGTMENHHGGVILVGDYVYGHSKNGWSCLDFKTGEAKWQEKKLGKGSVASADGMLYCLDEKSGECVLIEASSEGWKEHGRFKLDPQSTIRNKQGGIWTHPVISNGHLYLRDQDLIHCYAVK
jgi:outer membrane protein assembly factor BamB